jgi:hypothetical protein
MKRLLTLILITGWCLTSSGQVTWNFNTASPTSGVLANSTVSDVSQGNNSGSTTLITATSPSTGYVGASGGNNAGATAFTGALNTATSTYFEVTITPASGFAIAVVAMSLGNQSTDATGPQLVTVRSSLDGYTTDIGTVTISTTGVWGLTIPILGILNGTVDQPITLRIYGSDGTGTETPGTANWLMDDLSITYAVSVLAANLSSFNGSLTGTNKASLKWSSGGETSLAKYNIERSTDGINYTSIGSVTANGNSAGSYEYTDANVARAINFYRLKMVNTNGSFTYSSVVRLNNKPALSSTVSVYPSPASSTISTEFSAEQSQDASLTVIDAMGRIYMQQNIKIQKGNNNITVPVNKLSKGTYAVMIRSANGVNLESRFIKN